MLKTWLVEVWPVLWPILTSASACIVAATFAGFGTYLAWTQIMPPKAHSLFGITIKDLPLLLYVAAEIAVFVIAVGVCWAEYGIFVALIVGLVNLILIGLLVFILPLSFIWWMEKFDDTKNS